MVSVFLAASAWATAAPARPAAGESPLARWVHGLLIPAGASVVQVIAYRPDGSVPTAREGISSAFRLEPARRTFWATGVVVDRGGIVLTCSEAAQPGDSLEIRLPGGAHTGARFLAQDLEVGLSLLQAEDTTGLSPVPMVPLDAIREGEAVVLLGHRADKEGPDFRFARMSSGRGASAASRLLRLNLGDCHGACGDAVFDEHGAFRGIVVGVQAEREQAAAPAAGRPSADPFECESVRALSAENVPRIARDLLVASSSPVGFMGVIAVAGDPLVGAGRDSASSRLPLMITRVLPGSPADAAGIRPGDQLLALDGRPVASMEQVADLIAASPPGREVRVRVLREGTSLQFVTRLADRSALGWLERQEHREAARRKRLQMAIERLQREIRELDARRRPDR